MKTLFISLFIILSLSSNAQSKKEPNIKSIKTCLTFAGFSFAAGAITTVVKTYQIDTGTEKYKQKQKDLTRISSMFYGVAGASLVVICFNF